MKEKRCFITLLCLAFGVCFGKLFKDNKRVLLEETASPQDTMLKLQDLSTQLMNLKEELSVQTSQNAQLKDQISQMSEKQALLTSQLNEISQIQHNGNSKSSGPTYIRWGRSSCNGTDSVLVYSGYAAGNYYSSEGSGANILCLTSKPTFDKYHDGDDVHTGQIWGAEFELDIGNILDPRKYHNQDVVCSVCQSIGKQNALMIPGQTSCPTGWRKEYQGYMMTNSHMHQSESNYICVDKTPDLFIGGSANLNGLLLYLVEVRCGVLPCGPYQEGRELTCVVCSK